MDNILKNHKTSGNLINAISKIIKNEITEHRCGSLGKLAGALRAP